MRVALKRNHSCSTGQKGHCTNNPSFGVPVQKLQVLSPTRLEISAGAEEDDVEASNPDGGGSSGGDIAVDGMGEAVPVAADSPADVDAPAQQSDIVYHPRTALAKVCEQ